MRVISLLLVIGFSCSAARSDSLDAYRTSSAASLAGHYAYKLSAPPSLLIRVEIEEPDDPRMSARAVRGEDGHGCVLKIRQFLLRRPDIIAHETCHCVNDYPLLTPHGYNRSVTFDEVARMERAAKSCAEELKWK